MDDILLIMGNTWSNQVIMWNGYTLIGKNHQNLWAHSRFTKSFLLESAVSSKDKTLLMANSLRMYIGHEKSTGERNTRGYMLCSMWKSGGINKSCVFFECPPARQVWALSKIPSHPTVFPISSFYGNMDHLFWRVNPKMNDHQFAWILWYFWKDQNNKVFSSLDIDPRETLQKTELESSLWAEAQVANDPTREQQVQTSSTLVTQGRWCCIDGSWNDKEVFSGQDWYSTLPGFDGLLGARNVRACLSPLHSEVEALIWAMECMKNLRQFQVTFATDYSQLVKMVSEPEE